MDGEGNGLEAPPPRPEAGAPPRDRGKGRRRCYGEACRRQVLAWISPRVSNPADAQDLCQEVCTHCWNGRGALRDPAKFRPWLRRIVHNVCTDFGRKEAHREVPAPPDEIEEALAAAREEADEADEAAAEEAEEVRRVLARLGKRQRQVLELRYFDELAYAEIAERLKVKEHSVDRALSRAHAAFRRACEAMASEEA